MTEPDALPERPNAVIDRLCATYPVFRDRLPLAIGIHKSIVERQPDVDRRALRAALATYVGSTRYLKSIAQGERRFDLDGNPAGEITAEQREQAASTLRERFRKAADRRRSEEEQRERQEKLARLAEKFNTR